MDDEDHDTGAPDDQNDPRATNKSWRRLRDKIKTIKDVRARKDSNAELNHDELADFFGSSLTKPHVPKIDISAARKFSNASPPLEGTGERHEGEAQQMKVNSRRKPCRNPNLKVTFASKEPVIIGEGGDEALDPTRNISRALHEQRRQTASVKNQNEVSPGRSGLTAAQIAGVARKAVPTSFKSMPSDDSREIQFAQSTALTSSANTGNDRARSTATASAPRKSSNTQHLQGATATSELERHADEDRISDNAIPLRIPDLEKAQQYSSRFDASTDDETSPRKLPTQTRPPIEYVPLRGLRRMREDEGKALIAASRRNKNSFFEDVSAEHDNSSLLPTSLQVAPARLSVDSDLSTSQHSINSVTAFPGTLPPLINAVGATKDNTEEVQRDHVDRQTMSPLVREFSDRTDHLKSVFRLSSEVNKPSVGVSKVDWARIAIWWFLRCVSSIQDHVWRRSQATGGRILSSDASIDLMQNYVDLSKTWYILSEVLLFDLQDSNEEQNHREARVIKATLNQHFEHFVHYLDREQLMPPGNLLIQALDSAMWLKYPAFDADCLDTLAGRTYSPATAQEDAKFTTLALMPLGDSSTTYFYGRAFVMGRICPKDGSSNSEPFPCLVSMLRKKSDRHLSIVIASQTSIINIYVSGNRADGLTWEQVRWVGDSCSLRVNIGQGLRLTVKFAESDYRTLWSLYDYSCKIKSSLRPKADEIPTLRLDFKTVEYSDSAHPGAFAARKVELCHGFLYERFLLRYERFGERRIQSGYRLAITNDSQERDLRSVSIGLDQHSPLIYSFKDPNSSEMSLRVNQRDRQRRLDMEFSSNEALQEFVDHITGCSLQNTEHHHGITDAPVSLDVTTSGSAFPESNLASIKQWQGLDVFKQATSSSPNQDQENEASQAIRIVLNHSNGRFVDRINPLQERLPYRLDLLNPDRIQILRLPQEEATLSIGPAPAHPHLVTAMEHISRAIFSSETIRSYNFSSINELHCFQEEIMGCTVAFDANVQDFSVPHHRGILPTNKTKTSPARVQLVHIGPQIQFVAFFEAPLELGSCINFELKNTDSFEKFGKKDGTFGIRLVDAKFAAASSRPTSQEGLASREQLGRGFVSLRVLEYPSEHADILLVFATEAEREAFARALPAAPTEAKGFTLKRRI